MRSILCNLIEISVKIKMAKSNDGNYLSCVTNSEFNFKFEFLYKGKLFGWFILYTICILCIRRAFSYWYRVGVYLQEETPIYLYSYSISQNWFLNLIFEFDFCLFWTWFLQATQAVKIMFEIGRQTIKFKNQFLKIKTGH